MTIEAIRKLSLEYAAGHVRTGGTWRLAGHKKVRKETYAEWFAKSLVQGKKAGPPPNEPGAPQKPSWANKKVFKKERKSRANDPITDAHLRQDPGDDGKVPW